MEQFFAVWSALSPKRRVIVAAATLAMFGAVLLVSRAATTPSLTLLYSGLEPAAAGEVVAALEQRGVAFDVRGGAIYVDGALRDELRLTLASEGLPATGGAGYELLDSLSGFGTTSQMFDAAYWRAKEGELARTIAASPTVRSVRVHIAAAGATGFRTAPEPSASVAIVPSGQGITSQQARAVRFLVASAVAGLVPENVSVIDATRGLVIGAEDALTATGDPNRAAELKRNVERLLEARVGVGRAIVELAVETVTESEQITERRFDPDSRVAISTDTEERSARSSDARAGAVTVASNLPEGDDGDDGRSTSQNSETRERVNFEVSETQREVTRGPGAVRRITVAVLVDGVLVKDASGNETWQPRPDDEIAALRELVASAVGFEESRGDVITLKSMPFEAPTLTGSEIAGPGWTAFDTMSVVQLAVLAIVALVLGLFVVRPILAPRLPPAPRSLAGPAAPAAVAGALAPPEANVAPAMSALTGLPALDGEIDDDFFASGSFPSVNASLPSLGGDRGASLDTDDPVARLRRLIAERKDETIEILRSWMDDAEEKA